MSKRVKWITGSGGARSCAIVRGAIPAGLMNGSPFWHVEVKDQNSLYPYDPTSADIMVFQRYWDDSAIPYVRECRKNGVRTVFDVDDALWLLPTPEDKKEVARFGGLNVAPETVRAMKNFMEREVDAVTCSTTELAFAIRKLCHPRNLYVVPNYVDHRYFYPVNMGKTAEDRKSILWYAALGHNYSAGFFCKVVTQVLNEFPNVEINLIGCTQLFKELDPLIDFGNRIQQHPWVDYFTLGSYISNNDLVLCPVLDHPFTHCKSEIKALEAGACGVPMIMSDVPQYRRFSDKVLTPEETAVLLCPADENVWLTAIRSVLSGSVSLPRLSQRVNAAYGAIRCVEMWAECYNRILAK